MRENIFIIIAQEGFRDEELFKPLEVIRPSAYEPIIISPKGGVCKGMLGSTVQADLSLEQAEMNENTRAVVIVGGKNSPELMKYPEVGTLLSKAKEKKRIIAAICLGPMVVAHFNIIDGRHATVFETNESKQMFERHNITFIDEEVIVDDNIITANGPEAATAFGKNIVELIDEQHNTSTEESESEEE